MKSFKSDPWTGPCFSQLLRIGLLYYLHALDIILYESKRDAFIYFFLFLNKYQVPCEMWLQCKRLVWLSVIHSVCARVDVRLQPCWQPAASAARNKTRNKCFMKQTYTRLPYFLVTSLLPAAASKHLGLFVHFFFFVFVNFPPLTLITLFLFQMLRRKF